MEAKRRASDVSQRNVYVDVKKLPSFSGLNNLVQDIVKSSSAWERYGYDWMGVLGAVACVPIGLNLLAHPFLVAKALGMILLGCYHNCIAQKAGHLVLHGAYSPWRTFNEIITRVCVEVVGSFPTWLAHDIHIRIHHPHTNIIGLGDSSSWRAPYLTCIPYMFFAPMLLPILTPVLGVLMLVEAKQWRQLMMFLITMPAGIAIHMCLIMSYTSCSMLTAAVVLMAYRAVFMVPYIHINIFQHIGLPMYSQKNRPARIYQMATGSLNLTHNWFLDLTFGSSLTTCHVEHHLFPTLSDNMCTKVKPVVSKYLLENGLPYHEESYWQRMLVFLEHYDELMVNAPPITHFIGIQ
ncbi:hypothetical protein CAPTEDRAFT_154687 [Capitella teleta]|uniref:Fatty acid desaturase domain-containing protein n=1 Tax=Capitella teleta TaxID=283909 RepID=R7TAC9_CAPTE|nr:hypothetical protein CAPTEDRAFT_154687 [Capitella teleta]|eukprot:ELT90442.1 hypothetical protein CAPTEDRAFT_154687 [Capitella teleta]